MTQVDGAMHLHPSEATNGDSPELNATLDKAKEKPREKKSENSRRISEDQPTHGIPGQSRDRYAYNTCCSFCTDPHTEEKAVALCKQCPRIACHSCANSLGVQISRMRCASDVVLPGDMCLCLRWDSSFPKPPEGVQPEAYLLHQLLQHDLSFMFRTEVDVRENPGYLGVITREDMMDLGTVLTKLKQKKYQTKRGQRLFRKDIKQIWDNCRKFASYKPSDTKPIPGIVWCTFILENMVTKFYESYIEEEVLTFDEGCWLNFEERNKQSYPTRKVLHPCSSVKRPDFSVTTSKCGVSDVDTDLENGASAWSPDLRFEGIAGSKRKVSDGTLSSASEKNSASARIATAKRKSSSWEQGLVGGLCEMAGIGEELLYRKQFKT